MNPQTVDPLILFRDFAAELGVCVKTIYRRLDEGELPKQLKVGKCSRFPRSVIEAYKRKIEDRAIRP